MTSRRQVLRNVLVPTCGNYSLGKSVPRFEQCSLTWSGGTDYDLRIWRHQVMSSGEECFGCLLAVKTHLVKMCINEWYRFIWRLGVTKSCKVVRQVVTWQLGVAKSCQVARNVLFAYLLQVVPNGYKCYDLTICSRQVMSSSEKYFYCLSAEKIIWQKCLSGREWRHLIRGLVVLQVVIKIKTTTLRRQVMWSVEK